MVCCIQLCLVKSKGIEHQVSGDSEEDEENNTRCETYNELAEMMKSLTIRMITSEMEDFELVGDMFYLFDR